MAIYLDANVLWPWLHFTEPERLAISIVAHQLGQEVLVPEIAVIEAEEELRRRIEEELEKLWGAERGLQRILGEEVGVELEPGVDVDRHIERWRGRLEGFATVLPLSGEDAMEAFRREIEGRRPARPRQKGKHGAGGRDAAVWLTIVGDHLGRGEPGHLISADRKAFADEEGGLHRDLSSELSDAGGEQMDYHSDAGGLIETLGETGPSRPLDAQAVLERAREPVEAAAVDSRELAHAVWSEIRGDLRHRIQIEESDLLEISGQRRYEQGSDGVLAVDTRWRLVARLLWQDRDTDEPSMWGSYDGLVVTGDVQLLIEERGGELGAVEVLGAQFKSRTTLSVGADDRLLTIESFD
jgi:hypothetical protein